jgi:CDP-diacylglycerol---glycerol-3-phosphate 3-phosphatidyltransferase
MTIFTPSNFLSLMRGPLALLFIIDNVFYRSIIILLAMITDSLDGYLARRYRMTSQVGAFLDPLMDKLFVFIVLGIFIQEGRLQVWQALSLISRDFAVILFGFYLALKGVWSNFRFRSIWSGKITTALQFFMLLALTFHFPISPYFFSCFILLAISALLELYLTEQELIT